MQESENKIAVIAVHGVAYHAPGQSVRDIAGVLSSLSDTANYLKYSPFTQETIRIAVREVDGVLLETMPGSGGDDIAFTRRLLQGYRPGGSEAIYETTCLRGHRVCRDKGESVRQIPVDVYEMYWNDLSKVAGGKLGPLNTLYLLLFHLCDLGLNTIQNSTKSTVWERLFKAARCLLTVIIPQGNLLLLMLFLGVIPLGLKSAELIRAVAVLGAVLGTGGLGYIAYRFRRCWLKNAWGFFWVLVAGIALGGMGFMTFGFIASPSPYLSATLLGGTGTAVALALLFKRFESFRRTSSLYGRVLLSLIWAGLLFNFFRLGLPAQFSADSLAQAFLQVGILGLSLLLVLWLGFLVLASVTMVWGAFQSRGSGRKWQVWWTTWVTLWVPAALFIYLTEVIWLVFVAAAPHVVGNLTIALAQLCPESLAPLVNTIIFHGERSVELASGTMGLGSVLSRIGGFVVTTRFWLGLGLLAGSGLPALWAFLPSVADEVKSGASAPRSQPDEGQGNWLTQGYRAMKLSGVLVCASVLIRVWWGDPIIVNALLTLGISGGATLAVVLGAVVSRLSRLFAGLGTVVGVALDVDNHLREVPEDHTPRARMAARYASLLRYLIREGYTKLIIVAHSQGTVLTADLFRLLTAYTMSPEMAALEPSLQRMIAEKRVELMTMGNPLRQLYALRFPDLYAWAVRPQPTELGVASWINFYRTGDYVGRGLWVDNNDNSWARQPEPVPTPEGAWEQNIGRGAHTHYWDASAPEVAQALDRLIAEPAS